MDFGLNRFHNYHPQPRAAALDLMMVESPPPSVYEEEAAAVRGVDSDSDHGIGSCSEREHMFDKVVTPSDVGKLNRLVIPKQHAERYFPLDSSSNEKGLLLNFEDRNGKSWRFRYSYWNSSQSYVMTKGWSRFVKEKRLDAGDIVSFQRGVGDVGRDRLYIDWRRRPELPMEHSSTPTLRHNLIHLPPCRPSVVPAWSSLVWRPLGTATAPYSPMPPDHLHLSQLNNNNNTSSNTFDWNNSYGRSGGCSYGYGSVVKPDQLAESAVFYLRSGMAGGGGRAPQSAEGQDQIGIVQQQQQILSTSGNDHDDHHLQQQGDAVVYESVPVVVHGNSSRTPKRSRLRLFGVNMDCPISSAQDSSSDECDLFLSSSNATTAITSLSHQLSSSSTPQLHPPPPLNAASTPTLAPPHG